MNHIANPPNSRDAPRILKCKNSGCVPEFGYNVGAYEFQNENSTENESVSEPAA